MWSLFRKQRIRRALREKIGIWFHRNYESALTYPVPQNQNLRRHRATNALSFFFARGWLTHQDIHHPTPIGWNQLGQIHHKDYLENSATSLTLAHIFGLEEDELFVEGVLTSARAAVGGTMEAAVAVMQKRFPCAINLGGGFHHAKKASGSGFCVYNDIAAAVHTLRNIGHDTPILIVDLDFHQGDGNIDFFANDPNITIVSIDGARWSDAQGNNIHSRLLPAGTDDTLYLKTVDEFVLPKIKEHRHHLVFYIAGQDIHEDDALGLFKISTRGVFERDQRVVETCLDQQSPLVITLGGGYSNAATFNTRDLLQWLLTENAPAFKQQDASSSYVANSLDPHMLRGDKTATLEFSEEDILGDLGAAHKEQRILGYYSKSGIELGLEAYGVLPALRQQGFFDLRIDIAPDNPSHQVIRVFGAKKNDAAHLLCELVLRRLVYSAPAYFQDTFELLAIEWLLLQDPTTPFSQTRPKLPGQEHPGLGIATIVGELLVQAAKRLHLGGLFHRPAHYHIAYVGRKNFHFVDPTLEGRFRIFQECSNTLPLDQATDCIGRGAVRLSDGTPVTWEPGDFIYPLNDALRSYFFGTPYSLAVEAAARKLLQNGMRLRSSDGDAITSSS